MRNCDRMNARLQFAAVRQETPLPRSQSSETTEHVLHEDAQRALLNILEDFGAEKSQLESSQRAVLNILEDFHQEKTSLQDVQRAVLNILDDFSDEKARLASAERAMLNILEDFDAEKNKVEITNQQLEKQVEERKRAEQELAVRADELKRSNAELEQFAYVASHDLQEPLRMVASYTQLLSRRYKGRLDDDADEFIGFAVDGVKRMQALIQDLLAYSRVSTSKDALRETSSQAALDRALANLQGAIEDSGAIVTHETIPEVFADGAQLVQIFQNLIGNGIKYRRRDVTPRIHVSAVPRGQEWIFSVRDNGIGIDSQYFDRIFVLFQRLHQRDEYPGTGIGLTITKKIIERHGGRIWLESEPGQGSCFHFTMPQQRTQ